MTIASLLRILGYLRGNGGAARPQRTEASTSGPGRIVATGRGARHRRVTQARAVQPTHEVRQRWCALAVVMLLAAFVAACNDPEDRPATWAYIHATIIVPSCATASCHSELTRRAGIVLEDRTDAYQLLVGDRFAVAGDVRSPLLFLLEGDERTLMPPDAPLPAADVDLVRTWILQGAEGP